MATPDLPGRWAGVSSRSTCPKARRSLRSSANNDSSSPIMTPDEAEDHLILFVLNKRIIPKVEKLLQVGSVSF